MHIITVTDRKTLPLDQLLSLWQASVKATHHFLSQEEIAAIRPYVPDALKGVEHLLLAEKDNEIVGFYQHMGFQTVERHELDEQGNPYPILVMRR